MAFTFHSCSDRRGPPLVDAVRCSCESDPVVRSCPLNRLSPAKNHASQLGHVKQSARLFLQAAKRLFSLLCQGKNNHNEDHEEKEITQHDPPRFQERGESCLKTDPDYLFMTAGNYR